MFHSEFLQLHEEFCDLMVIVCMRMLFFLFLTLLIVRDSTIRCSQHMICNRHSSYFKIFSSVAESLHSIIYKRVNHTLANLYFDYRLLVSMLLILLLVKVDIYNCNKQSFAQLVQSKHFSDLFLQ